MNLGIGIAISSGRKPATAVIPGNGGKFENWPQGGNKDLPMGGPDGKQSGKMEHWPKKKELPPVLTM